MIAAIMALAIGISLQDAAQIALITEIEAKKHALDSKMVLAIIMTESRFNKKATGALGEVGLMQLRPQFHSASYDIKDNLKKGIRYLAYARDKCYNKYGEAWIVCFNGGTGIRLKRPLEFAYYKKVRENYGKIENFYTRLTLQD
jgi:soluble lytic murein transglycosylase-like protein